MGSLLRFGTLLEIMLRHYDLPISSFVAFWFRNEFLPRIERLILHCTNIQCRDQTFDLFCSNVRQLGGEPILNLLRFRAHLALVYN
jgi:hypothetical protein